MKILFVLENYYPNIGGVETLFKHLAEQLVRDGHQVTVLTTLVDKNSPKKEVIGSLTIHRIAFPNRYFFTFFGIFPILKHIRSYDLVQTTSYNAGVPAFFAAKLFGKKVVITFHEAWGKLWFKLPYMSKFAKYLHYGFEQFLLKLPFDKFIAVSKNTAKRLEEEGVKKDRIKVIYNGIQYHEFENIFPLKQKKERKPVFTYTYFGRLGMSKGLDILLEAAITLKDQLPDSCLQMIIPKVPEHLYQEVMNFVQKNDLQEYIHFQHNLPFQTLKQVLKASDCVIVPSYSEGFCFAAVETIALSVPLISSDQAALKEVISGTFIKMEEHNTKSLVDAVRKAYQSQWTVTPIKKFLLKDTIKNYVKLYQQF